MRVVFENLTSGEARGQALLSHGVLLHWFPCGTQSCPAAMGLVLFLAIAVLWPFSLLKVVTRRFTSGTDLSSGSGQGHLITFPPRISLTPVL